MFRQHQSVLYFGAGALALGALILAAPPAAQADTVLQYSTVGAFDAAVGPTTTQDFTFAPECFYLTGPLSSAGGACTSVPYAGYALPAGSIQPGVTYSVPAAAYSTAFGIVGGGVLGGLNALGGFVDAAHPVGSVPLTVTFNGPVSGFALGEYVIDDATSLTVTLHFVGGGSMVETEAVSYTVPLSAPLFFGFQSSAQDISSVQIASNGTYADFTLASFAFSAEAAPQTPEPTSVLLVGTAMLGLLAFRRRLARQEMLAIHKTKENQSCFE